MVRSIGDFRVLRAQRVFVGSGGYEGLIAIVEVTEERDQGCIADVRGIIFEGGPVPEPYVVE